jgi:modulator of FtsH protease HflC
MRNVSLGIIGAIVVVAIILLYSSVVIVDQRQQAVVLQFGALARAPVTEPGLLFIVPFLQNVRVFEKRIQPLETDAEEIIVGQNTRIVVDAFVRYRITDAVAYIRGAATDEMARQRLLSLLNSALRRVLGKHQLAELLSGERETLMHEIRDVMRVGARDLGIEMVDVRIRRADLPSQNQESVFQRMQAERKQQADKKRAEGDEDALKITSDADRLVTILRAEATQKSEILRGEGDAERNRVLGEAYGRDPEFFEFYRSLKAYEEAMNGQNTTMVITPDSPFFKYFQRGQTGGR